MKRILTVFKDLQDSGQDAAIVGHFSLQLGNLQEVANIDNVHEQTKTALSETDAGKNPNRYTTEHGRDDVDAYRPASASLRLQSDLIEVINIWQNLPDSIRAGIFAMIKAMNG